MLVYFAIQNFRSYRDRQVLTWAATDDQELPENLLVVEHELANCPSRLVKSVALLGGNAAGKTNLLEAVHCLKWLVRKGTLEKDFFAPLPFALEDECENRPTEFEIGFVEHDEFFEYRLSVLGTTVVQEQLDVTTGAARSPTSIFSRIRDRRGRERWTPERVEIPANELFLTHAPQGRLARFSRVRGWFSRIHFKGLYSPQVVFESEERCATDEKFRDWAKRMLARADVGIVDIAVEETAVRPGPRFHVRMVHENRGGGRVEFRLNQESLGTIEYFNLLVLWYDLCKSGGVLVIDELDQSLHPNLCRALVESVHNPAFNAKRGQLLFTTHDITLIDASLLRRDQVYFAEKSADGVSRLTAMSEYIATPGETAQKSYLSGRYGGVPVLQELRP